MQSLKRDPVRNAYARFVSAMVANTAETDCAVGTSPIEKSRDLAFPVSVSFEKSGPAHSPLLLLVFFSPRHPDGKSRSFKTILSARRWSPARIAILAFPSVE